MYQPHPSSKLSKLFKDKPFQGAAPDKAKFVFVGLDANYANDLENLSCFQDVLDYHEDGVLFWHVFLSAGVIRLMPATGFFEWFPKAKPKQVLPNLITIKEIRIYQH